MRFLLRVVLNTVGVLLAARIIPGIDVSSAATALVAGIALGVVNAVIRPILIVLTLPFTLLTLGLFIFIVNAFCLGLVAWIGPGFRVHGFRSALVGSVFITLAGRSARCWSTNSVTSDRRARPSRAAAALAAALIAAAVISSSAAAPDFPADVDAYLTKYVSLDAHAREQLLAGAAVTKMLDADSSKEVAVFGAVRVNAPVERYIAAVRDIERFESGGAFRVTKKISSPPRLDDFAQLTIPEDDFNDLRNCRVAQCELKLPEETIKRMRQDVDWKAAGARDQVTRIMREEAVQYVTGYLEGGNERLAVYRDAERPTFVAKEFESMIERLPALDEFVPKVRRYLLEFPRATLPGMVDSFVYWQEAKFGLKPTIRINHLVIAEDPNGAIVASKMLYASHYFWTALELRALVRDPARAGGFWFVTESRSRSDGLSGFTGRVIRGKVHGEAEKGTAAQLLMTKTRLESK
jgi:putative membrane protein